MTAKEKHSLTPFTDINKTNTQWPEIEKKVQIADWSSEMHAFLVNLARDRPIRPKPDD